MLKLLCLLIPLVTSTYGAPTDNGKASVTAIFKMKDDNSSTSTSYKCTVSSTIASLLPLKQSKGPNDSKCLAFSKATFDVTCEPPLPAGTQKRKFNADITTDANSVFSALNVKNKSIPGLSGTIQGSLIVDKKGAAKADTVTVCYTQSTEEKVIETLKASIAKKPTKN